MDLKAGAEYSARAAVYAVCVEHAVCVVYVDAVGGAGVQDLGAAGAL